MADSGAKQLAEIVRDARTRHGWTQKKLAEEAGVSIPTVQRCEAAAGISAPRARKLFLALSIDPRHLPVLLGYVTAEEMGMPAKPQRVFSPQTEAAIAILEDPRIPPDAVEQWVRMLEFLAADHATPDGRKPRRRG
jgi:transcriptional regulator with XRE-family HTH domain